LDIFDTLVSPPLTTEQSTFLKKITRACFLLFSFSFFSITDEKKAKKNKKIVKVTGGQGLNCERMNVSCKARLSAIRLNLIFYSPALSSVEV